MPGEPFVLEVRGFEKVQANLRNLYERAPAEFGQAAREKMDDAMMESQAECPYDFSNPHADGSPHLRDTALVEGPIFEDDNVVILLSYSTPYAAIQHEVPEFRHLYPTKWKFLEDPVNRQIPRLGPELIWRMEKILQGSNERMQFTSPYAARRDYARAQDAFAAANLASVGHLVGRFA